MRRPHLNCLRETSPRLTPSSATSLQSMSPLVTAVAPPAMSADHELRDRSAPGAFAVEEPRRRYLRGLEVWLVQIAHEIRGRVGQEHVHTALLEPQGDVSQAHLR